MSDEIVVALIMGGASFAGVILTCVTSNKRIETKLQVSQAKTDVKIDNLTDEVRKHNNFAVRTPVLEQEIIDIKKELATLKAYHMKNKKEE